MDNVLNYTTEHTLDFYPTQLFIIFSSSTEFRLKRFFTLIPGMGIFIYQNIILNLSIMQNDSLLCEPAFAGFIISMNFMSYNPTLFHKTFYEISNRWLMTAQQIFSNGKWHIKYYNLRNVKTIGLPEYNTNIHYIAPKIICFPFLLCIYNYTYR